MPGTTNTYVAAVLTDRARAKLLRLVPAVHPTVVAHHMTMIYNPERELFWEQYARLIGQKVQLTINGKAHDERVQAVLVSKGPVSINEFKHVTISTAPGVEQVESNELLKKGWKEFEPRIFDAVIRNLSVETDSPV